MFLQLTWKEIKYQLRSLTFYAFIGAVVVFMMTNYYNDFTEVFTIPQPGQEGGYGITTNINEFEEMQSVYRGLEWDLERGGTYRYVPLSKTEKHSEEQSKFLEEGLKRMCPNGYPESEEDIAISYEEYLTFVRRFDELIGGNTPYGDSMRGGYRSLTYEEAIAEYDQLKEEKFTDAYGRLFADYIGITAGLFPIFLVAFMLLREKKHKAHELVFSSPVSSLTYVAAKYTAVVICVFTVFMVLASISTFTFMRDAHQAGVAINYTGFYKYTLTWVMPTAMVTLILGMFLSLLFNNGIVPIVLQVVFWFATLSATDLEGAYGLRSFVIRYNGITPSNDFMSVSDGLVMNRIFYILVSLVLFGLTVVVWSKRRHTINNEGRWLSGEKRKEGAL